MAERKRFHLGHPGLARSPTHPAPVCDFLSHLTTRLLPCRGSTRYRSRCANLPSQLMLLPWQICKPQRWQPTLLSPRHYFHHCKMKPPLGIRNKGLPTLARPWMAESERHEVVEASPFILMPKGGLNLKWVKVMAEREGFEPPSELPRCRFSKPVQSTTLPSLRNIDPIAICNCFRGGNNHNLGPDSGKW